MKAFFLVGSIVFTVLILIISFQNLGVSFMGFTVFFSSIEANGTMVLLGMSLLGICTGGFYFGFLNSLFKGEEEEEEDAGTME